MVRNCNRMTRINRIRRYSGGLWRFPQLCSSHFIVIILWTASCLSRVRRQGTKSGVSLHLRAVKTRTMSHKKLAEVEVRLTSEKPTDDQIGGGSWVP